MEALQGRGRRGRAQGARTARRCCGRTTAARASSRACPIRRAGVRRRAGRGRWCEEGGVRFTVPAGGGQKTGWFFDQARESAGARANTSAARACSTSSATSAPGVCARAPARPRSRASMPRQRGARRSAGERGGQRRSKPRRSAATRSTCWKRCTPQRRALRRRRARSARVRQAAQGHPEGQAAYRRLNQLGDAAARARRAAGVVLVLVSSARRAAARRDPDGARHVDRIVQVLQSAARRPIIRCIRRSRRRAISRRSSAAWCAMKRERCSTILAQLEPR